MTPPRKRGAQTGNTNALKHGLYSSRLTTLNQKLAFAEAELLDPRDLAQEIALVRSRLALLPKARLDLALAAVRTLANLMSVHHRLSPKAAQDLGEAAANLILGVGVLLGDPLIPDNQPL